MASSEEIVGDVTYLLKKESKYNIKDEEINNICVEHMLALRLLGSAFVILRIIEPTKADIVDTEKYIKDSLAQVQKMGLSIMQKVHVLENHTTKQLCAFKGIGNKTEDFIEHSHQDGCKLKNWYCGITEYGSKRDTLLKAEHSGTGSKVCSLIVVGKKKTPKVGSDKASQILSRGAFVRRHLLKQCSSFAIFLCAKQKSKYPHTPRIQNQNVQPKTGCCPPGQGKNLMTLSAQGAGLH